MVLQFPNMRERRRRAGQEERPALAKPKLPAPEYAALAACHAELQAIARSATALAFYRAQKKEKPRQGGT
jgi:hypothetical protein